MSKMIKCDYLDICTRLNLNKYYLLPILTILPAILCIEIILPLSRKMTVLNIYRYQILLVRNEFEYFLCVLNVLILF